MREDMGGTYGVGVYSDDSVIPRARYRFHVMFGCEPDRVEEMIDTVFEQVELLKRNGPGQENIQKIREGQTRNWEEMIVTNSFWSRQFYYRTVYGLDMDAILDFPDWVVSLSEERIRQTAVEFLDTDNYVQVILMPEEEGSKENDGP
jgi:zinc protease